jgi:hypothetical protein
LDCAPNALAKLIRARMKIPFGLGRFCLGVVAVGLMFYAYQYAMSQAIHTVIASQPPMPKLADPPRFADFNGCDLGLTLSGSKPVRPCRFELRPPPASPAPLPQMSKGDSETAALWFMLAALALPLALGGAAVAGLWVIKDR